MATGAATERWPGASLRLGGDPGRHPGFVQISAELAKLAHPACPDVDWTRVEQLCLELFQADGPQLQSAAAYALACSHLYGVPGMLDGVGLIETLASQWAYLLPVQAEARVALLVGLCGQLHKVLRVQDCGRSEAGLLDHLDAQLARLQGLLAGPAPATLEALQGLRRQLGLLIRRLAVDRQAGHERQPRVLPPQPLPSVARMAPLSVLPAITPDPAPQGAPPPGRRRFWALTGLLVLALAVLLSARHSGWPGDETPPAVPPRVLDSLMLFEPGSAEPGPQASETLVRVLEQIRLHPGWLVVITGHADASGTAGQNQRLSLARAQAVSDWLTHEGGLPAACLAVRGIADTWPVASNDTAPGRTANRRVDIRLMPGHDRCMASGPDDRAGR